jgi:hypothetical protein
MQICSFCLLVCQFSLVHVVVGEGLQHLSVKLEKILMRSNCLLVECYASSGKCVVCMYILSIIKRYL